MTNVFHYVVIKPLFISDANQYNQKIGGGGLLEDPQSGVVSAKKRQQIAERSLYIVEKDAVHSSLVCQYYYACTNYLAFRFSSRLIFWSNICLQ